MTLGLPKSVEVGGKEYQIRYDYRAVLEICIALSDPELSDADKACAALVIFYPTINDIPHEHYQEALDACMTFINCGEKEVQSKKSPVLVDWEQDYKHIVPAINRVIGCEIRNIEYDDKTNTGGFHWWSFVGAYMEIGECLFGQIIRIRRKKASGERLDKSEQKWYRENRNIVDIKTKFTEAEAEVLSAWGIK